MVVFVLLAVLSAPPDANLDAFLAIVEQETRRAIEDSPRVLEEMRNRARTSAGAERRELLAQMRGYETRIKELRAGRSVVVPLMPFARRPGDIGRIPTPVKLIEKLGRDCVVEADWNTPQPDLIGQVQVPDRAGPNQSARLLIREFPATPFQIGQDMDIGVICVAGGQEVHRGQAVTVVSPLEIPETRIPKLIQQRRRGARGF